MISASGLLADCQPAMRSHLCKTGPAVTGPFGSFDTNATERADPFRSAVPIDPDHRYRASRRNSRAVRRPSRRASRPARRPSRRASRPSRRAARRSCPAVWASASVTRAGAVATNPPNAAASPRRENAPRREIISVPLIMLYSRVTTCPAWTAVYSKKVQHPAMQKPVAGDQSRAAVPPGANATQVTGLPRTCATTSAAAPSASMAGSKMISAGATCACAATPRSYAT
jgi:hypothetical protein